MAYITWKGSVTDYKRLHRHIGEMFGKPNLCEDCGTRKSPRFEWANLSGKYTRLRKDWKRLCAKCHRNLDAASFVGKRFAGKAHSAESRAKTAETMRLYWQENPEKMKAAHAKASKAKRENNLRRRNG